MGLAGCFGIGKGKMVDLPREVEGEGRYYLLMKEFKE
jgi:hypothetical protein